MAGLKNGIGIIHHPIVGDNTNNGRTTPIMVEMDIDLKALACAGSSVGRPRKDDLFHKLLTFYVNPGFFQLLYYQLLNFNKTEKCKPYVNHVCDLLYKTKKHEMGKN